jgi:hypothetical protein
MTVRVRQLIQEIAERSPAERQELESSLHPEVATPAEPRYLDRATAQPMIKEILTEHSELFRKLAQ